MNADERKSRKWPFNSFPSAFIRVHLRLIPLRWPLRRWDVDGVDVDPTLRVARPQGPVVHACRDAAADDGADPVEPVRSPQARDARLERGDQRRAEAARRV